MSRSDERSGAAAKCRYLCLFYSRQNSEALLGVRFSTVRYQSRLATLYGLVGLWAVGGVL